MTRLSRTLALAVTLGAALAVAPFASAADPAATAGVPGAAKAAGTAAVKAAAPAAAKAVNINTASVKELTKLNGIGEKLGKAIVDYRTKNGPFKAPEDLMKVKGIGEKKYAALKPLIAVQ